MPGSRRTRTRTPKRAETYKHPEADSAMRPEVGTQAQFRKKKPPAEYLYDSSLSPALDWDTNPAREQGEALIARILEAETIEDAKAAAAELRALGEPFLNWAGKAERLSFDVPTLPLFVYERLSTKAILETLKRHRKDQQADLFDLFGDPQHSIADQVLRAYEHRDRWVASVERSTPWLPVDLQDRARLVHPIAQSYPGQPEKPNCPAWLCPPQHTVPPVFKIPQRCE